MKKGSFVSIITAIIIFLLIFYFIIYPYTLGDKSWGEDGELSLEISIDKTELTLNNSLNVTFTLQNIGDSDLRVISHFLFSIRIYDLTNNTVNYTGEIGIFPILKNDDLEILHSKKSLTSGYRIKYNYDPRENEYYDWEFDINKAYRVIGHYNSGDHNEITLPYWKGELRSNELYFTVIE